MSDDSGDIISAQDNDNFIQDVKAFLKKGTLPCHTVDYRNKVEKTGKDAFLDKGIVWVWMNRPTRSPYVCMYEKVATVAVSIEEMVSLGQGERGPDRDSYFPKVANHSLRRK